MPYNVGDCTHFWDYIIISNTIFKDIQPLLHHLQIRLNKMTNMNG